jgi:hypothetical protein
MLRLWDVRADSYAELAMTRPIPLRVCVNGPSRGAGYGLEDVRVLLVADLLTRVAELRGLQAIIVLASATPAAGALDHYVRALGIHEPAVCASSEEAEALLGGPAHVHVTADRAGRGGGRSGVLIVVGPVDEGAFRGNGTDLLALRLALLSHAYRQAVKLTEAALAGAGATVSRWRHAVAAWAREPSRPIPAETVRRLADAFDDDLNTVAALELLVSVESDRAIPPGAKFETFAFTDRVLGLELVREIGH